MMTFVLTYENPARQIFCECSAEGSNDKAREKTIVQQDEGLFQVITPFLYLQTFLIHIFPYPLLTYLAYICLSI